MRLLRKRQLLQPGAAPASPQRPATYFPCEDTCVAKADSGLSNAPAHVDLSLYLRRSVSHVRSSCALPFRRAL